MTVLRLAIAMAMIASALVPHDDAAAQAHPAVQDAAWVDLQLGISAQRVDCTACSGGGGGPAVTVSGGLTLRDGMGIALLYRGFEAFSLSSASSGSRYVIGLVQFSPPEASFLTVNAGVGLASHHSGSTSGGDVVAGAVAGGVAFRFPASSVIGFVLSGDYIESLSGTRAATSAQPASSYRPRQTTVSLGISLRTP